MQCKQNKILELIDKASNEFQTAFAQCRTLFATDDTRNGLSHAGEFGMYRERIAREFIAKFLPLYMDVGDGFLINKDGATSTQTDIVIYDRETTPRLESTGAKFFPSETVYGIGQIKSKLNRSTLSEALRTLEQAKAIRNSIPANPYPNRPAEINEYIFNIINTADLDQLNAFYDFTDIIPIIEEFRAGNVWVDIKPIIFNLRIFEQLNFVSFLICESIENIDGLMQESHGPLTFTPIPTEHFRFNLILSVEDGVFFHEAHLDRGGTKHRMPYPYPMHLNRKCGVVFSPATQDNAHIRIFISLLLQALTRTALYEFSPLAYWSETENLLNDKCRTLWG